MQTGDFDNAKSTAALSQENSLDATCMSMPNAPGTLLFVIAMYMSVSKFVTAVEILSPSRITSRHGQSVLDVDGWEKNVTKAHTSTHTQERGTDTCIA